MHVAFIPYGTRPEVELLLRDMEAQNFLLFLKKNKKVKAINIHGAIRQMPLGIYEYVFPREYKDIVLFTLKAKENRYDLNKIFLKIINKLVKLKPVPKYEEKKYFPWIKENVNIITLGIREDIDLTETEGQHKNWTHEAI